MGKEKGKKEKVKYCRMKVKESGKQYKWNNWGEKKKEKQIKGKKVRSKETKEEEKKEARH